MDDNIPIDEALGEQIENVNVNLNLNEEENLNQVEIQDKIVEDSDVKDLDNTNFKEECTALVVAKPNSIFVATKVMKKSLKMSIKSFLISVSLGILNFFI